MTIYSGFSRIFPLRMVIFHCYVSSPEGTSDTFTSFSTAQDLRVLRQARENGELQHPALSQPKMKKVDASQQLAGGFKTFSNM